MDWQSVAALITIAVALYGAGLSTYNALAARAQKRRIVKVKLSNGMLTLASGLSDLMIFIEASNPGHRAVTINIPGILLPNKQTVVFPEPTGNVSFPHILEEGQSCMIWTDARMLAKELAGHDLTGKVKLRGFCYDAIGTQYLSDKWVFDVDEWSKEE